jgi:tripartite-type tricarboxylate transporter receptor subunit TctC
MTRSEPPRACSKTVPTLEEAGFKGFDAQQWYGVVGPAGLPVDVLKTLKRYPHRDSPGA